MAVWGFLKGPKIEVRSFHRHHGICCKDRLFRLFWEALRNDMYLGHG